MIKKSVKLYDLMVPTFENHINHSPCLLKTQWYNQLQWHLPSLDLWLLCTIDCEIQFCYPVLNKEWLDIYVDIWNFQGSYPKCTVLILLKDIKFWVWNNSSCKKFFLTYLGIYFPFVWVFEENGMDGIKKDMGTHLAWKSLLFKRFLAVLKCLEFFIIR